MGKVLLCLLSLCLSASALAPMPDDNLLFELAVDATLPRELLHVEVSQSKTIFEHVREVFMRGTALTRGLVGAEAVPHPFAVGIDLVLDSETDAATVNTTEPRPGIGVRFDWSITTWARTVKRLELTETGFSTQPARTAARSNITIHNVETYAGGLFPRLKRRLAYRAAWKELMATKARNEAQAAAKIARELDVTVDRRAREMLEPVERSYRRYVHAPLIGRGYLGGRLRMLTTPRGIVIQGVGDRDRPAAPAAIGKVSGADRIVARLTPRGLSNLVASRFAGAVMADVDLAELLHGDEGPLATLEQVAGSADELVMTFDDKMPVSAAFQDDVVALTLHLRSIATRGRHVGPIRATFPIAICREGGGLSLMPGPPALAGTIGDTGLEAHVRERLRAMLPATPIDLSKWKLPLKKLPYALRDLQARDGALTFLVGPKGGLP